MNEPMNIKNAQIIYTPSVPNPLICVSPTPPTPFVFGNISLIKFSFVVYLYQIFISTDEVKNLLIANDRNGTVAVVANLRMCWFTWDEKV